MVSDMCSNLSNLHYIYTRYISRTYVEFDSILYLLSSKTLKCDIVYKVFIYIPYG